MQKIFEFPGCAQCKQCCNFTDMTLWDIPCFNDDEKQAFQEIDISFHEVDGYRKPEFTLHGNM